jgi:hypothetical protein
VAYWNGGGNGIVCEEVGGSEVKNKFWCTIHKVEYRSGDPSSCECAVSPIISPSHVIRWAGEEDFPVYDWYRNFWFQQSRWSQETFGSDQERGPRGPILHLVKEVKEVLDALNEVSGHAYDSGYKFPVQMELVDCFFLVTDAARRSGLTYEDFMNLVFKKLEINKKRNWGGGKYNPNMPVEHDRTNED